MKRQAVALVVAAVVFVGLMKIDYRKLRDFSLLAYVVTVGLLFLVLTPVGSSSKGAQAWFQLPFGLQFQPSEIAKFGLIVALAGYVNEHRGDIDPWRLTVIIGLALVPLGLVQLQPDLGTNMVLICVVLGLLAVGGVKGRYLGVVALLAHHRRLRGDQPRDPEAVPDRPADDSVRERDGEAPPGRGVQPGPVGEDHRHRRAHRARPLQGPADASSASSPSSRPTSSSPPSAKSSGSSAPP